MASLSIHSLVHPTISFGIPRHPPSVPPESFSQDLGKLFGGLLPKLWPLLVVTLLSSYTCRHSGSHPSSLFHSEKGKVIHPHENSWRDFALNEKGGALMVDFQVPTDQVILVWP